MKCIIITILLLTSGLNLVAQKRDIPITIGYYAPFAIQIGGKLGTSFSIKNWEKEASKSRTLLISPQISFFLRPNVHENYLINSEIGIKSKKEGRKIYFLPSLGLGYLLTANTLSSTVDLGTGDIISKDKELRAFFLPTINYEIGKDINEKIGYYFKAFYGRKISSKVEDAGFFGLEIGGRFHLFRKNGDTKY